MSEERDMQVYELHRDEDVSGISGSGHVADAVVFHNGKCVVSWRGPKPSIVVYDALEDAKAIHGHNGSTRFVPVEVPFVGTLDETIAYLKEPEATEATAPSTE